jgi:hypothetical protein
LVSCGEHFERSGACHPSCGSGAGAAQVEFLKALVRGRRLCVQICSGDQSFGWHCMRTTCLLVARCPFRWAVQRRDMLYSQLWSDVCLGPRDAYPSVLPTLTMCSPHLEGVCFWKGDVPGASLCMAVCGMVNSPRHQPLYLCSVELYGLPLSPFNGSARTVRVGVRVCWALCKAHARALWACFVSHGGVASDSPVHLTERLS